jgi:hypothetical protein
MEGSDLPFRSRSLSADKFLICTHSIEARPLPTSRMFVLYCHACGKWFGVSASTGKSLPKLTDPFEATCMSCAEQSIYTKSEVLVREKP